jgi:hypothetical protein
MGGGEAAPFGKIGRILEQLLEGFEQLEECLGSFFAHWQASLEELASLPKGGIDPAYGGDSNSTNSLGYSASEGQIAQEKGINDPASSSANGSGPLPGAEEKLPRVADRLFAAAPCPESATGNLLAVYLVEQLERLQQQRDELQAQCNQLAIRLAEKTQQAAQFSDLLEQHKRQLLHYQQQWMHHLQLLRPFLDSAISHLTEFASAPSVGDNSLKGEEFGESAPGPSHQILSLPTFRERKTSTG